jgi:hypothetical protein
VIPCLHLEKKFFPEAQEVCNLSFPLGLRPLTISLGAFIPPVTLLPLDHELLNNTLI